MMLSRANLLDCLNTLLCQRPIPDHCPNGLQVQGRDNISRVITGVTASYALLEQAVLVKADAVLVHHGFFWKQEDPCIIGPKYQRLRLLLEHDINLIAYHLPLDLHPELGNNAQLAAVLELEITASLPLFGVPGLGFVGHLRDRKACSATLFAEWIAHQLGRVPLHLVGRSTDIQTVAWCTGAAQEGIEWAASMGVDAYLSGEVSERTMHLAHELGVHYFACGHHATERYGVQALGAYLVSQFGIEHQFIEIDNPV